MSLNIINLLFVIIIMYFINFTCTDIPLILKLFRHGYYYLTIHRRLNIVIYGYQNIVL